MSFPFGNFDMIPDERIPKDQVWIYSRRPRVIFIHEGPYAGTKLLREPDAKIVNIGTEGDGKA
jgi:hypothetical protein